MIARVNCVNALKQASFISTSLEESTDRIEMCVNALKQASFISTYRVITY